MSRTLLVTDDSMIIRELVKDVARRDGWEIVGEAADGQQAVEQFQRLRPDGVTLDLVMPRFDGLHALKGIKALDQAAKVLVVSAIDQSDVLREAVKLGAADFVVKPFEDHRLQKALDLLASPS
ncbi:MAG: response regulator [Planctomycetales bacterium]|nr:response regulator [Planctomycetales bacterium]MBN8625076.1 response regulator [Planctomycetota bacterium]